MTTIGQLISKLFTDYRKQFHDDELAAVATQVVLEELLREQQAHRRKPALQRQAA